MRRTAPRAGAGCIASVAGRIGFPPTALACLLLGAVGAAGARVEAATARALPRIQVAPGGRTFITEAGRPFVPFGVSYYRPRTGWAPQLWKQFDAEGTRADFAKLRDLV